MCGLAGFAGTPDNAMTRFLLALALGREIDDRGGHGIGFVTVNGSEIGFERDMSDWGNVDLQFVKRASTAELSMLHARYATCGKKTTDDAHPFLLERDGKPILYGMHNGMIDNARASASAHNRDFTVDSLELLELLADGDTEAIAKLEGYGTLVWVRADDLQTVRMVRMTGHADLYVAKLTEQGYVYGSTRAIVHAGLDAAELHEQCNYKIDVGQVYGLRANGFFEMANERLTLADRWTAARGNVTSGKAGTNVIPISRTVEEELTFEGFGDWYKKQEADDRAYLNHVIDKDDDEIVLEAASDFDEDGYYQDAAHEFLERLSPITIISYSKYGIDSLGRADLRDIYSDDAERVEQEIHKIVEYVETDARLHG